MEGSVWEKRAEMGQYMKFPVQGERILDTERTVVR